MFFAEVHKMGACAMILITKWWTQVMRSIDVPDDHVMKGKKGRETLSAMLF